jgi:hydroxymethylpyrimidine/phosphomethylpyrimidine kinase
MTSPLPLVLCLSGHDPTGGAGLHADIEAVAACGGHALSIVTAHTVQDTSDVLRVTPVAPLLIAQQIETLANDCEIAAIKIGLLGDAEQIPILVRWIARLQKPVVFDPVLRAGGGSNLASAALIAAVTADAQRRRSASSGTGQQVAAGERPSSAGHGLPKHPDHRWRRTG